MQITKVAIRDINTGQLFKMPCEAILHASAADPDFSRDLEFGFFTDHFLTRTQAGAGAPKIRLDS